MTDSEKTDEKTPEQTPEPTPPPASPAPPAAPATDHSRLEELITALPETVVNALKEGLKILEPKPPAEPAPPAGPPASETSPGTTEPKLPFWFKPLSAWGKDKK